MALKGSGTAAPSTRVLTDQIIRVVEINRAALNGLTFGQVTFDVARGELVGLSASTNVRLSAGAQLCPLALRNAASPESE